jgi:hypothetical protein
VEADLDLHGERVGQGGAAHARPQAPVDAARGQGEDEIDRALDVEAREEPRGARPDAAERGEVGEEREEDVGAAHPAVTARAPAPGAEAALRRRGRRRRVGASAGPSASCLALV